MAVWCDSSFSDCDSVFIAYNLWCIVCVFYICEYARVFSVYSVTILCVVVPVFSVYSVTGLCVVMPVSLVCIV